jgi:phosphoribosyl-dephospho-CoA transferase
MHRHDLIHVAPDVWEDVIQVNPVLCKLPLIDAWASQGWPVIVRRWMPGEPRASIPVAVPLPPAHGKQRIGMLLVSDRGLTPCAPVTLSAACEILPPHWRNAVEALLAFANRHGHTNDLAPCVFGSALWQSLTQLSYLSPTSDLDLLWPISHHDSATRLIDALTRIEAHAPMRLDGEFVLPGGAAVNWREWALALRARDATVLVKTMDKIEMVARRNLFDPAGVRS